MAEAPIDLNNLEQILQIKECMLYNRQIANKKVNQFPFDQLEELDVSNFELIGALADVIVRFLACANPRQITYVIKFYKKIIRYHIDNELEDSAGLLKSLNELLLCFEWVAIFKKKLYCNQLIELFYDVINYSGATDEIVQVTILSFTQLLPLLNPSTLSDEFDHIALSIYRATPRTEMKLQLCNELCSLDYFPSISEIWQYVIECVPYLNKGNDKNMIIYILNCFINIYDKCKTESILDSLSFALVQNNFPACIACHFHEAADVMDQIKVTYKLQLCCIFRKTPWNSSNVSLPQIIDQLAPSFSFVHDADEEFKFIEYYLEFLYKGTRHHNGAAIAKEIQDKYENHIPHNNPALLKSIYLLYAAYIPKEAKLTDFYNLLLSLQQMRPLEHYLTYHISQLVWVITFGSRPLKLKVVTFFILNYKNHNHISNLLKCCGDHACLVDVIHLNNEKALQVQALDILEKSTTAEECFLLVLKLMFKSNVSFRMVTVVMESNITSGRSLPKEANLTKEEICNFIFVIRRFSRLLSDEAKNIPDQLNALIIKYLHRLCVCVKNNTEATKAFVVSKLVKRMVAWTQSDDADLVLAALNFLTLIVEAQHYHFEVSEQVEFKTCNFRGGDKVIRTAIWLLRGIMRKSSEIHNILIIRRPYLLLYCDLLNVLTSKHGKDVVTLLTYLMDKERECVASFMNVVCITMHCRQYTEDENFICYLVHWCSKAFAENNFIVPLKYIIKYVRHLNSIQYANVDYSKLRTLLFNLGHM